MTIKQLNLHNTEAAVRDLLILPLPLGGYLNDRILDQSWEILVVQTFPCSHVSFFFFFMYLSDCQSTRDHILCRTTDRHIAMRMYYISSVLGVHCTDI